MVAVAKYTVDVAYRIDQKSVRRVDTALASLDKKLKAFSKRLNSSLNLNVNKFNIDQRRLNLAIGRAFDIASQRNSLEISRFVVDQTSLNRSLISALRVASRVASASVNVRANVSGGAREAASGIRGRHVVGAGGIGGLAARAYGPAIALGLGGYGLGALNRRNQEVVSAQLQSTAVIQQAGGTQAQGVQSFDYLRSEGDRIGFNYLDASGDYNKLISGLTGSGVSIGDSQQVFSGFAELARVNKLDKTTQNRLFRALSQVAGKGKLQAEELTGQISEALPGGTALFARAYQAKLAAEGKGGGLIGQAAIAQLQADMKKGLVTSDILSYAGRSASSDAKSGLPAASRASQAEQARFQNTVSNSAILASTSGLESGFTRLFRALNDGLKESGPMVESLARGFDNTSKYVSAILLSVQSLQRFFQGRDSFLGDKLFPDEESQQKAFQSLEQLKSLMTEMDKLGTNIYNGWDKLFKLLDNSSVLDKINSSFSVLSNSAHVVNSVVDGNYKEALSSVQAIGKKTLNNITAPGRVGANAMLRIGTDSLNSFTPNLNLDNIQAAYGVDLSGQLQAPQLTGFSNTDSELDWRTNYKAEQARMAAASRNQHTLPGINQAGQLQPGQKAIDFSVKMDVEIRAANPEDFNQQWQDRFQSELQSIFTQYTEKE